MRFEVGSDMGRDGKGDGNREPIADELQEEIARRVLVDGEPQKAVLADMQARGVKVSRTTVSRICQRVKDRATLPRKPEPALPPTVHQDPETGIEVELTEDLILRDMSRDMWREYKRAGLRDKVQIAKVLPALAVARLRLREPPPQRPGDAAQSQQEPPPPAEFVSFN